MVTAFHRLAVWPHMCVSDDNAGHEEPLVAAVYNKLFQVVNPLNSSPSALHAHLMCCAKNSSGMNKAT